MTNKVISCEKFDDSIKWMIQGCWSYLYGLFLEFFSSLTFLWFLGIKQLEQVRNSEPSKFFLLISLSQVDSSFFNFLFSNHTHIVISFNQSVSYLFVEVISTVIDACTVSLKDKGIINLLCIFQSLFAHGDELDLSWRNPKVPFTSSVLA